MSVSVKVSVSGREEKKIKERERGVRVSRKVDVWSMGCIVYFVLTDGGHPFGDSFEREVRIRKKEVNLSVRRV